MCLNFPCLDIEIEILHGEIGYFLLNCYYSFICPYLELKIFDSLCLNEVYVLCIKEAKSTPPPNYPVPFPIFFSSCSYVLFCFVLIEMLRPCSTLSGNFKPDFSKDLGPSSICEMRLIQLSRLKTLERQDFPNCDVMSSVLSWLKINISEL